jgi:hypothetical protein
LKSRPHRSEKYQILASFWAKREVERKRKRKRIGRLGDWEIGGLGDLMVG